jgi:3-O-methylgallate 3,4-dioxygenase
MSRSIAFGKVLYEALTAWDSSARVAIIASGGLSHFVCDEQADQVFIESFKTYDFDRLAAIDNNTYQSGTSEVKLYVPVMVAMEKLKAEMHLVDYVPCYRTEAGTGEGMGFFYWVPRQVSTDRLQKAPPDSSGGAFVF